MVKFLFHVKTVVSQASRKVQFPGALESLIDADIIPYIKTISLKTNAITGGVSLQTNNI